MPSLLPHRRNFGLLGVVWVGASGKALEEKEGGEGGRVDLEPDIRFAGSTDVFRSLTLQ